MNTLDHRLQIVEQIDEKKCLDIPTDQQKKTFVHLVKLDISEDDV
jgi:hypothetical protein